MNDRTRTDRVTIAAEQQSLERLARLLIRLIQAVAALLAVAFAYLELQNAPIDRLTQAFDAHSPTKLGLFLFFAGWFYGATHDTEIQASAYKLNPGEGGIGAKEVGGIVAFLAFFILLFLMHERLVVFQALLTGFILINIAGWRQILSSARPIISRSEEHYISTRDNGGWAKLSIVVDYMNGRWQRRRFAVLVLLCLVQLAVAFLAQAGILGRLLAGSTFNGVPGERLAAYLPGSLFVVYVVISEVWMKIYRVKAFSDLKTVEHLDRYFAITRQRGLPLPPIEVKGLTDRSVTLNENYC